MQRLYKKNKGAITLLISVIILTLLGIVTLYTVKLNVMDQRTVASEADYQEAFTMAEAGLDFAIQRFTNEFNSPRYANEEYAEDEVMTLSSKFTNRRKTDGSSAGRNEAGFTVEIGCKRDDNADEIVSCTENAFPPSVMRFIAAEYPITQSQIKSRKREYYNDLSDYYVKDNITPQIQVTVDFYYQGMFEGYDDTVPMLHREESFIIDNFIQGNKGGHPVGPKILNLIQQRIEGARIYEFVATGFSANNNSQVTVRRQMSMEPVLRGVSVVPLIVDGELDAGGDYHIKPNSRSYPFAIWASGDVYMRGDSAVCMNNLNSYFRTTPVPAWDSVDGCVTMGILKDLLPSAAINYFEASRCAWNSVYAQAGIGRVYEVLREVSMRDGLAPIRHFNLNRSCQAMNATDIAYMKNSNPPYMLIENPTLPDDALQNEVKGDEDEPYTLVRSRDRRGYDDDDDNMTRKNNGMVGGILPNARTDPDRPFPNDLFNYTFGVPRADWKTIKDKAEKRDQLRSGCNDLTANSGAKYILWWITGNCNLNAGQAIGTRDRPVVLVIDDARLQMLAGSHIYGRIFLFDRPGNTAKPSARFGTSATGRTYISGGLTSDVGAITINSALIINAYTMNRFVDNEHTTTLATKHGDNFDAIDGIGVGGPRYMRPALAEFGVSRNYDLIDIPGSWRDY